MAQSGLLRTFQNLELRSTTMRVDGETPRSKAC